MNPPQQIDLSCPCGAAERLDAAGLLARLQQAGLLRRVKQEAWETLVALAQGAAERLVCPACGGVGVRVEPAEIGEDAAWGRPCEACGQALDPERLEVFPDAVLCPHCQRRADRGEAVGAKEYCPRCGAVLITRRRRGAGVAAYELACPECRR